jgi:hypothetical protein
VLGLLVVPVRAHDHPPLMTTKTTIDHNPR